MNSSERVFSHREIIEEYRVELPQRRKSRLPKPLDHDNAGSRGRPAPQAGKNDWIRLYDGVRPRAQLLDAIGGIAAPKPNLQDVAVF